MTLPTNTNGMRVLNTLPQKNNTKDQRTPPTYLSAISRKTFFLSLPFFQPLLSLLLQTSSHLFRPSFLFSKANQMHFFPSFPILKQQPSCPRGPLPLQSPPSHSPFLLLETLTRKSI